MVYGDGPREPVMTPSQVAPAAQASTAFAEVTIGAPTVTKLAAATAAIPRRINVNFIFFLFT
jgi:hypothetical protein